MQRRLAYRDLIHYSLAVLQGFARMIPLRLSFLEQRAAAIVIQVSSGYCQQRHSF